MAAKTPAQDTLPPLDSLIKPHHILQLVCLPGHSKVQHFSTVTDLWRTIRASPPDSRQFQRACKRLFHVSKIVEATIGDTEMHHAATRAAAEENQVSQFSFRIYFVIQISHVERYSPRTCIPPTIFEARVFWLDIDLLTPNITVFVDWPKSLRYLLEFFPTERGHVPNPFIRIPCHPRVRSSFLLSMPDNLFSREEGLPNLGLSGHL